MFSKQLCLFNLFVGFIFCQEAQLIQQNGQKFNWSGLPHAIKWKIMDLAGVNNIPNRLQVIKLLNMNTRSTCCAISPDGEKLACNDEDWVKIEDGKKSLHHNQIVIWDCKQNKLINRIHVDELSDVICLAWNPASDKLVTGLRTHKIPYSHNEGSVRVYDIKQGNALVILEDDSMIEDIDWSSKGTHIAGAGKYTGMKIWDALSGKKIFHDFGQGCNKVKWNKQNDKVFFADTINDNEGYVWDTVTNEKINFGSLANINCIDWHPNGKLIAIGSNQETPMVLDIEKQHMLNFKQCPMIKQRAIKDIAWHPSGNYLITACHDGWIQLWNKNGEMQSQMPHGQQANWVAWLPGGTVFATWCSELNQLRFYKRKLDANGYSTMQRSKMLSDRKRTKTRETLIDPLKLYLITKKFNQSVSKIECNPMNLTKKTLQDMTQLKGLGFTDQEIEKMLLNKKNILVGHEEYDYYNYLKSEVGDALHGLEVGLKGQDICLDEFLQANSVVPKKTANNDTYCVIS